MEAGNVNIDINRVGLRRRRVYRCTDEMNRDALFLADSIVDAARLANSKLLHPVSKVELVWTEVFEEVLEG